MTKKKLLPSLKKGYCPNSYKFIYEGYEEDCINNYDYNYECEYKQREKCWNSFMESYDLVVSDEPIHSIKHWDYSFDFIKSDNEKCYLFPCGTLVSVDEYCNVKEVTINGIKKDI